MDTQEFSSFERLIAPKYITELFWVGVAASVLAGVGVIVGDFFPALLGVAVLIGGPVLTRVGCEVLVLAFKAVDWIAEIRALLEEQQAHPVVEQPPGRPETSGAPSRETSSGKSSSRDGPLSKTASDRESALS